MKASRLELLVKSKGLVTVENATELLQRVMRGYSVRVQYSRMLREQVLKVIESSECRSKSQCWQRIEERSKKVGKGLRELEFKKDDEHSLTLGYDSNPQSLLMGEAAAHDIRYYSETPQTTRQEVTAQFLSNQ